MLATATVTEAKARGCPVGRCTNRSRGRVALLVCIVALSSRPCSGALLNLTQDNPDIFSSGIKVTYDYDRTTKQGAFTATGKAYRLTEDGVTPGSTVTTNISNGSFSITATLTGTGELLPGGSLAIKSGSTTLLSGTLAKFGYQSAEELASLGSATHGPRVFQFEFNQLQGTYASKFGAQVGVILSGGDITFDGYFNKDFGRYNMLYSSKMAADTFAEVPEPASLALWSLSGLAFIASALRTRTRLAVITS